MMTTKRKSQAEVNPLTTLSDKKLLRELSSMFEFALRYLGYSESAAARRIRVARCMREFPEVELLLREKKLSLSTVSKLRGVITGANKDSLLARVVGSSSREVDEIVARLRPSYRVPDRVRPVFVIRDVKESDRTGAGGGINEEGGREFTAGVGGKKSASPGSGSCACGDEGPGNGPCGGASDLCGEGSSDDPKDRSSCPSSSRVEVERRFKLEFAVGGAFMEKLERVRELLSSSHPAGMSFEDVFGTLIDEYIERYSPESRIRRRTERRERAKRKAERDNAVRDKNNAENEVKTVGRIGKRENGKIPEDKGAGVKRDKKLGETKMRIKTGGKPEGGAGAKTNGKVRDSMGGPKSGTEGDKNAEAKRSEVKSRGRIKDNKWDSPGERSTDRPHVNKPRSRHIPRSVRDEVWARDGGRCAYVSPAGVRCTSRWNLEIDHVVPFARGGGNDAGNLRLLCAKHNRVEAERVYGIQRSIGPRCRAEKSA